MKASKMKVLNSIEKKIKLVATELCNKIDKELLFRGYENSYQ